MKGWWPHTLCICTSSLTCRTAFSLIIYNQKMRLCSRNADNNHARKLINVWIVTGSSLREAFRPAIIRRHAKKNNAHLRLGQHFQRVDSSFLLDPVDFPESSLVYLAQVLVLLLLVAGQERKFRQKERLGLRNGPRGLARFVR